MWVMRESDEERIRTKIFPDDANGARSLNRLIIKGIRNR
jgi:hypothetical protein